MAGISNVVSGFRLILGEKINEIITAVNNLTGNGTPGAVTGTTGVFSSTLTALNAAQGAGTNVHTPTIKAAAGASQGDAAAITTGLVIVTVTASTQGVKLPTAATGQVVMIMVPGTKGVKVYPATGDRISTASTNAAVALVADKANLYVAKDTVTWAVQKGA